MSRAAVRCQICGAVCRCKNAREGMCCSCHPHKGHKRTQSRGAALFGSSGPLHDSLSTGEVDEARAQLELEQDGAR